MNNSIDAILIQHLQTHVELSEKHKARFFVAHAPLGLAMIILSAFITTNFSYAVIIGVVMTAMISMFAPDKYTKKFLGARYVDTRKAYAVQSPITLRAFNDYLSQCYGINMAWEADSGPYGTFLPHRSRLIRLPHSGETFMVATANGPKRVFYRVIDNEVHLLDAAHRRYHHRMHRIDQTAEVVAQA